MFLQAAFHGSMMSGRLPPCLTCANNAKERENHEKRARSVGILRPDIILYEEVHPDGANIMQISEKDRPKMDLLLIVGTSLKIPGVDRLIDGFLKAPRRSSKPKHAILIDVKLGLDHKELMTKYPQLLAIEWDCQDFAACAMDRLNVESAGNGQESQRVVALCNYSGIV